MLNTAQSDVNTPFNGVTGLPAWLRVLERGWLSSNNILILGGSHAALIDSGYCSHAAQTMALVESALQGRHLTTLVNTHLHSDHCGGNAALQQRFADVQTLIPPGLAQHVCVWNPDALTYTPTGQSCPPFTHQGLLVPGTEIMLGDRPWQIHAAPGHDPHSVILLEPASGVLVSADALWERGFGVVFPELDGQRAFAEVAATLDLIESLRPKLVIPGHGAHFTGVAQALATARRRLDGFVNNPALHMLYAAKVLLKFKLLEVQGISRTALLEWAQGTAYLHTMYTTRFTGFTLAQSVDQLLQELVRAGAASVEGDMVYNA
jgi:glyoxylase-like metal-dependent hydrolase (beta-lactamase superfamily II)